MTTIETPVDESNADQARAWDGGEGACWAVHHEILESCLARYDPAFMAAADISSSDRVLDIGCGTGVSTRGAARAASAGHALGVDLSSRMIDVARSIADDEGLRNVSFARADAQVHPFATDAYDVVISRTGAMFFGDPTKAFTNLRRSLRPGGRLALLTWQPPDRQEWINAFSLALAGRTPPAPAPGAAGPFALSDPDHVRALLEQAGFTEIGLAGFAETTSYGRTVREAHALVVGLLGWMLEGHEPGRRDAAVEALRTTLAAHQTDDGVRFGFAAWVVTARRPRQR
ncbi:class I SAM-dependent methyltransferase [Kineosporia sp. A_224]|uniref:class I SAM-dependent methyltransferase n=1 Tax=Kineosporia sp. A_224 TaxID=1962180 RepID=UPI0018E93662|nr:class I SAM-dependent methyltransferase [Kineosporia sp. A_224]